MQILDRKLDYDDVLIVPQRSELNSRSEVDLSRKFVTKHSNVELNICPIIASNMYNTGTIEMAKSFLKYNLMTALHKFYSSDELIDFILDKSMNVFFTIGESEDELHRLREYLWKPILMNGDVDYKSLICIDVANGYRASFVNYIKKIREEFPRIVIMAGNVCTPEMTQELLLAGADIIKVGTGPGSRCKTRQTAGVGYPQLSTIIECANAAHGLKGLICADGGCKIPADICKSFCAGADFVMLGGMLAGTDECEGDWTYSDDGSKKSIKFFGMSSYEAMEKFGGKDKEYRASEGDCVEIPYKGPVENVVKEILGGLRSCGSYIGADRLKDFSKCATFVKVK